MLVKCSDLPDLLINLSNKILVCICTCMNRVRSAAEKMQSMLKPLCPEVSLYILNSLNTSWDDH